MVRNPHYAWIAPLVAFPAAIVVNVMMLILGSTDETTRAMKFIFGLLPLLTFLTFIVVGFIWSVRCLKGGQHVGTGIAGLTVNALALVFVVGLILLLLPALDGARQAAKIVQTQNHIDRICADISPQLPMDLDDMTTFERIYHDPPMQLNVVYQLHGITAKQIMSNDLDQQLEQGMREQAASDAIIQSLAGTGATIYYVYRHEDGTLIADFSVTP